MTQSIDDSQLNYFTNRATCYRNLQMWEEAMYDGETVLKIEPRNLKALMFTAESKIKRAISVSNCGSAEILRQARSLLYKGCFL